MLTHLPFMKNSQSMYHSLLRRLQISAAVLVSVCTLALPPALRAAGYLLVGSFSGNDVFRYDEDSGAFVDIFVPPKSGQLRSPLGLVFGPDGNLFAASGFNVNGSSFDKVLRYNGSTGAFLNDFADQNVLNSPRGILFGADGKLYVADESATGAVVWRFDGQSGNFLGYFVAPGSGGLAHPLYMVFGPDGDLYVGEVHDSAVKRYDGTSGAYKEDFVAAGVGGLSHPQGLVFGPDGHLYVACNSGAVFNPGPILRFQGPNEPNPGTFIDTFVPAGTGGLSVPLGLLFGLGDQPGTLNLYVVSTTIVNGQALAGTSQVLRFNGRTGQFVDSFVTPDSGGLNFPAFMTFTETDPTTLNYTGSQP